MRHHDSITHLVRGRRTLLPDAALLRHLVDSATHGAVAFCCWGVFLCELALADRDFRRRHRLCFPRRTPQQHPQRTLAPLSPSCTYYRKLVMRCTLAGVAAALLDVDHFIAAGSFSIDGATHLQGRPFGHAVTFIAVLVAAVRRYARRRSAWTRRFRSSFVVVSLLSHQLRDGFRRGLWCWPLGSTPPIPYALYLVMEQGLPLVMAHWVLRVRDTRRSDDADDDGGDGDNGRAVNLLTKAGQIDDNEEETLPLTAREENEDSDESDADPRAFSGQLIV
jgi:hypothetical protein